MNNTPISSKDHEDNQPSASDAERSTPQVLDAQPIPPQPWQERGEQHRLEEWETSRRLLAVSRTLLRRYMVLTEAKPSLADVTRMLELASKLGRLATGLATEKTEISGQGGGPLRIEFRAMLDKVYGQPLPGEIPLLKPPDPSVDLYPTPNLNPNPASVPDENETETLNQ